MTPRRPNESPRGGPKLSLRGLSLLGTVSAAVLCASVNVMVARFYTRWDVTSGSLYTLSKVTTETLARLDQPIEVVVFLSRSDPLMHSVRTLLEAYGGETASLSVRFVDPDQNPAEFIALQQRYGIFEGRTENGRLASEASIVLARGERRWFVTTDDLVEFDENDGSSKPRLEQALTEGIVNLLQHQEVSVCVTQGHRELAFDGGGPQSLSEFRRELERSNLDVRSVDLTSPDPTETLEGCRLTIVPGPSVPFANAAARRLAEHLARGASLFVLVGPVSDDEGRILDPSLGPVLAPLGIEFQNDLVFEADERLRLPVGIGGEVFLASPRDHATTHGLFERGEIRDRVLIQLGQGLLLRETSTAIPILETSDTAYDIQSFRLLQSGEAAAEEERAGEGRYVVAAAWEKAHSPDASPALGPATRVVVLGTPSVLWPSTFLDPGLLATRRFVESTLSWLIAQPTLVSVPEKPAQQAGLDLSEATLEEVQRYVLLYMPLVVLCLGALVVYRRRKELPE
jgi:hypothetical protein